MIHVHMSLFVKREAVQDGEPIGKKTYESVS